ncbi:Sedlin, region [Opisthorchis viverrini]|uniref:Sedlin, region n=1 Tax=Opisthorchis viverrini TaxID=6198 RepID=A0A1S8X9G4_OPIVI|nr:Sedlin, region [Opisthorchis viverrini]
MVGRYYFAIVGREDEALFDFEYSTNKGNGQKFEELRYLNQFIAHASLDVIDDQMWTANGTYLKSVDKFNEWIVSAFVTPGRILCITKPELRMVLLHDEPNDTRIRNFFNDVYEAYVKVGTVESPDVCFHFPVGAKSIFRPCKAHYFSKLHEENATVNKQTFRLTNPTYWCNCDILIY